jgi:hypothetical protein
VNHEGQRTATGEEGRWGGTGVRAERVGGVKDPGWEWGGSEGPRGGGGRQRICKGADCPPRRVRAPLTCCVSAHASRAPLAVTLRKGPTPIHTQQAAAAAEAASRSAAGWWRPAAAGLGLEGGVRGRVGHGGGNGTAAAGGGDGARGIQWRRETKGEASEQVASPRKTTGALIQ